MTHTTRFLDPKEEVSAFFPGRSGYDSWKVRPSNFQKWVKKFKGMGDPHDHLAIFKQVVREKHINNLHIKVESFGLTLKGSVLSWFQTLNPSDYHSFEAHEKDFIVAFSKMGLKHDVLS